MAIVMSEELEKYVTANKKKVGKLDATPIKLIEEMVAIAGNIPEMEVDGKTVKKTAAFQQYFHTDFDYNKATSYLLANGYEYISEYRKIGTADENAKALLDYQKIITDAMLDDSSKREPVYMRPETFKKYQEMLEGFKNGVRGGVSAGLMDAAINAIYDEFMQRKNSK